MRLTLFLMYASETLEGFCQNVSCLRCSYRTPTFTSFFFFLATVNILLWRNETITFRLLQLTWMTFPPSKCKRRSLFVCAGNGRMRPLSSHSSMLNNEPRSLMQRRVNRDTSRMQPLVIGVCFAIHPIIFSFFFLLFSLPFLSFYPARPQYLRPPASKGRAAYHHHHHQEPGCSTRLTHTRFGGGNAVCCPTALTLVKLTSEL